MNIVAAVLLMLLTIVGAVFVFMYVVNAVRVPHAVTLGVARVDAVVVYNVSGRIEGELFVYSLSATGHPDAVYFDTIDGRFAARGVVYQGVLVPHKLSVIRFVVVEGSIRPYERYVVRLGVAGAGYIVSSVPAYVEPGSSGLRSSTVYVYYVSGASSLRQYVSNVTQLAEALKAVWKVRIISSPEELEDLIKNARDLHGIAVINVHGEVVPAPSWVWRSAGCLNMTGYWWQWQWIGDPPKWIEWYREIRDAISRGLIWVSVGGWPFFYVTNSSYDAAPTTCKPFYQVDICSESTGSIAGCEWGSWRGYQGLDYIVYGVKGLVDQGKDVDCVPGVSGIYSRLNTTLITLAESVDRLLASLGSGYTIPLSYEVDYADRPCNLTGLPYLDYHGFDYAGARWSLVYAVRIGEGWLAAIGARQDGLTTEERAAFTVLLLLDLFSRS